MHSRDSKTRLIAIIGDPIHHSLTPLIQGQALQQLGVPFANLAFRVAPSQLEAAVHGARAMGFAGLMVTIPHKEAVLRLCDQLHPSAQQMGAANLLEFRDDGIIGHSSDGWAALKSLAEHEVQVQGARIVILGAGGGARSLALTFARAGAAELRIINRTLPRAEALAAEVRELGVAAVAGGPEEQEALLLGATLLVNATSIGMTPHPQETPVPASQLRADMAVYDIVYNPLHTRLLQEAEAIGAKTITGEGMLVNTNVYALKVCAGLNAEQLHEAWKVMTEAAVAALGG